MIGMIEVHAMEKWQARFLRWMAGLSVLVHAGILLLGSAVSSLYPPAPFLPVVTVELTEDPVSTLPVEEPPPPSPAPQIPERDISSRPAVSPRPAAPPRPAADRWMKRLDAGLASVAEAPVARKMGEPGGIPVRHWESDAAPRPGDFPPAVAPENKALLRKITDLEGKILRSGIPGIGTGEEIEASVMFGGVGSSKGDPIPDWIRDMIRRKVRGYLPELEAAYSAGYRRNSELKGKLLIRFRIDPSGKIVSADTVQASFYDTAFVANVLAKIRQWTFDSTDGRTVEVLYPFIFVAPS